jgi:hypothetical protein
VYLFRLIIAITIILSEYYQKQRMSNQDLHHNSNNNRNVYHPPINHHSGKVEQFLKENHIDFVDSGRMDPSETMKPMNVSIDTTQFKPDDIMHLLEAHGQMAETLTNTELNHSELDDMNPADTGGQDDI